MDSEEFEKLAVRLGESPDLRRIQQRPCLGVPVAGDTRKGPFLDVETTGLEPMNDEIIQLAMVRFTIP